MNKQQCTLGYTKLQAIVYDMSGVYHDTLRLRLNFDIGSEPAYTVRPTS